MKVAESGPPNIFSFLKVVRTLAKVTESIFFRALETKSFQQPEECLFKKKSRILVRTISFVAFSHSLSDSFPPKPHSGHSLSLAASRGGIVGLELLKSPSPENVLLFDLTGDSL